jgi:hypothetical protein
VRKLIGIMLIQPDRYPFMNRIEVKRSKTAMVVAIIVAIVIILMGCIMLLNGGPGWCLTPGGIAVLLAGILGLRDDKPRVIITENGITVRELGTGEISWQQIQSARIETIAGAGNFILLDLVDGKTHRFFVEGLKLREGAILRMIRERISEESQPES